MLKRTLVFLLMLAASWCVMTFTHELGHLIGGWCGGATLQSAELRPWRLPYSLFHPDPHPLVTLWSGPLLGVALPMSVAWFVGRQSTWFIAYFCALANGCYLAAAWYTGDPELDTSKLIGHGASPASVAAYCLLTIGFGYDRFRKCCVRYWSQSARQCSWGSTNTR